MERQYRICTRCVMDTSDPLIEFDERGVCNHCTAMLARMRSVVDLDPARLEATLAQVKREGRKKRYDCVLGVSGGVDSTYLAYLARGFGLRVLAVHLDNGWNSELAVKNIEQALNKLGIDLYTKVLDWEMFRDLQLAFLKSSTPDCEIPTDHAIHALLYRTASREGVRYILQGMNMRTEGIMPASWTSGAYDWRYIKAVHRRFGSVPLGDFPHFTLRDRLVNFAVRRLRVLCLLNNVDYTKQKAMAVLRDELGWKDYPTKHGESIYTRFYQSYILPRKFGIDKRRAHLSCLVVSGQLARDAALEQLAHDPYLPDMLAFEREYVIKKLGLSEREFERIMAAPPRTRREYPNSESLINAIGLAIRLGRRMRLVPATTGL